MTKLVLLFWFFWSSNSAWALFGSNPLAARESTQIANRRQIQDRLKLQGRQYLSQLEQWRVQLSQLDIERRMGLTLPVPGVGDPWGFLDRPAFDLEASRQRRQLLWHPPPSDRQKPAKRQYSQRQERDSDAEIWLTQAYARVTAARQASVTATRSRLASLRGYNAQAGGLTQALQVANLLDGELAASVLEERHEEHVHHQVLDEKKARQAAWEAARQAWRRQALAQARATLRRLQAEGPIF